MFDYIIFGVFDNGLMIVCAMVGFELDSYISNKIKWFPKGLGAVVGAGLGNTLSDGLGGLAALNIELATGTAAGCLIGLLFIPTILILKRIYRIVRSKINDYYFFNEEF